MGFVFHLRLERKILSMLPHSQKSKSYFRILKEPKGRMAHWQTIVQGLKS